MSRINANFESALEKLVRTMTRNFGTEVLIQGNQAYVREDGTIVLPVLEEMSEEVYRDLNGFLDSAVAKVKYTDRSQEKLLVSRFHEELFDAVETSRAQNRLIQEYSGCALNLDSLNDKWQGKLTANLAKYPVPTQLVVALKRAFDNNPLSDRQIAPFKRLYDAALPIIKDAQRVLSSTDDFAMTREVREFTEKAVKAIMAEREQQRQEEQQEQEQQKKDKQKGQKQKGQKSKQNKLDTFGDEKSEGEGEESEDENADGNDSADGEGDSDGDSKKGDNRKDESTKKESGEYEPSESGDNDSDEDEDGEVEENDDSADGDFDSSQSGVPQTETDEMFSEEVDAENSKFDKAPLNVEAFINNNVAKELRDAPDANLNSGWYGNTNVKEAVSIPFTTKFDTVTNHSGKGNTSEYAERKREVMKFINPIRATLERTLVAMADERFRFERERGMIDTRTLGRLVTDNNFKTPFKDFQRTETRDVAVELLIDLSGSMSGQKLEVAKRAALAIGEALMALGMKFEVTGFHTGSARSSEASRMTDGLSEKELARFNRMPNETLEHHVFKDFDTQNLTGICEARSAGANADGESVKWAVQRLAARPERRKILMVFSDGQPASGGSSYIGAGDLLRMVNLTMKSGIEVVGFGIQTSCVSKFYKDHVIIDDLNQLPTKVMTKVAKILEKGFEKMN